MSDEPPLNLHDSQTRPLPHSWSWTTVGESLELIDYRGRTPPYSDAGVPHLRSTNVKAGRIVWENLRFVSPIDYEAYMTRGLPKSGDLLFTTEGPLGDVAQVPVDRFSIAQRIILIRPPHDHINSRFLMYQIMSDEFQRALRQRGTGSTVMGISSRNFQSVPFCVAPLPIQERIAEKIEELFSDLDAGVSALERAKANLKRYRASVLKAAVEGRLTADWRAANPDIEPATELLHRILTTRRQTWEAIQLAEYERQGKKPPACWKEKYIEPVAPVSLTQKGLPDRWTHVSIDQIAQCLDSMRVPVNKIERAARAGDTPYYGANGQVGTIDGHLFDEPLVLVVEDETFIGRKIPFSYKITGKSWVNNHAHILRATDATSTDFLNYALMHYDFIPMTTGTTARRKLTKKRLMEAPLALPPLREQEQIVQEIALRLSSLDYTEKVLEAGLQRATRLRQGILNRAFEGKLVLQAAKESTADAPEFVGITK